MNILPHKSWHVYNRKNIEKVRKDEAKAKEKESAKLERATKAESESRLQLLRDKANRRLGEESSSALTIPTKTSAAAPTHIRLFEDLEKNSKNEERVAEDKSKDERWERQVTMYLDKDATDKAKPWYAKTGDNFTDPHRKTFQSRDDNKDRKRKRPSLKIENDPLDAIRNCLEKRDNKTYRDSSQKRKDKKKAASSSSSIEALRAQRIERERNERTRTRAVVFGEAPDKRPPMREIITLQLGQYANFVGTHYWNAQEEYFNYGDNDSKPNILEHDVLYRAGKTIKGVETYTPRVLVYDLKGGFGAMSKYNKLFGDDPLPSGPASCQWDQDVTRVASERFNKNAYQQQLDLMEEDEAITEVDNEAINQLDTSVETWSDFNRIYYHPRSINQVTTHRHHDDLKPFDAYTIGQQAYEDNEKETETFEDNFRVFAEECDQLQGFHVFCDVDDAFGGFTEGLIHDIRDEYSKASILTYGLSSRTYSTSIKRQKADLNRILSTVRLSELSSVYIPIYAPTQNQLRSSAWSQYIHPNCELQYHSSAIISAAIETTSLPYRLKRNFTSLADILSHLQRSSMAKLASLAATLPLPLYQGSVDLNLNFLKRSPPSLLNFTVSSKKEVQSFGEVVVARGLPSFLDRNDYKELLFSPFRDENSPLHQRYLVDAAYPLPNSYPRFFDSSVGSDGFIKNDDTSFTQPPQSVPMLTHLSTGPALHGILKSQITALKGIRPNSFIDYTEGNYGLSHEDFLDMRENLETMADAYEIDE